MEKVSIKSDSVTTKRPYLNGIGPNINLKWKTTKLVDLTLHVYDTMESTGWKIYSSSTAGVEKVSIKKAVVPAIIEDPDLLNLSDTEIKAAFDSLFGAWAGREDFTEEDLEDMRRSWSDRLDDLYGQDSEDHSI